MQLFYSLICVHSDGKQKYLISERAKSKSLKTSGANRWLTLYWCVSFIQGMHGKFISWHAEAAHVSSALHRLYLLPQNLSLYKRSFHDLIYLWAIYGNLYTHTQRRNWEIKIFCRWKMVEKYSSEILKRLLTTSVKICSPHSFVEPCHVRLLALFMEVFVDYRVNCCDLQHNAQTVSFRRFVSHVRSLW